METAELIKAGKLLEARQQLVAEVKSAPGDPGKRTTLCQVLCFLGEWDKAERHLDAMGVQDPQRNTGIQAYKDLILAERERIEITSMGKRPAFLPEAPAYFETYWQALAYISDGKPDAAQSLFEQIETQRPVISGTVNDTPFTGIQDTDSTVSYFMEAIVHERYVWLAFESIRELVITPPETLFDLLWVPGHITAWSGLTLNCYLPVLYAGSFTHDNEQLQLGRMTDWQALGGAFSKARGQHVYEIGDRDMSLLEIREIKFRPPVEAAGP